MYFIGWMEKAVREFQIACGCWRWQVALYGDWVAAGVGPPLFARFVVRIIECRLRLDMI